MYNDFAKVYDRFQEIDYDEFVGFYKKIFDVFGILPKTILDLGCGSGEIMLRLLKEGYFVTGIDISEDMLTMAQEKLIDENQDALLLNMDMTDFSMPEKSDVIISSLDCINYLTEYENIVSAFKCVREALFDDGLFIFDINSEYKLKNVLGNNTFVYEDDDAFCVWDCAYFSDDRVCGFELNFFIKEDELYKRYFEYQEERAYSVDEIRKALDKAGLEIMGLYADLTLDEPIDNSERLFFVCKIKTTGGEE